MKTLNLIVSVFYGGSLVMIGAITLLSLARVAIRAWREMMGEVNRRIEQETEGG